MVCVSTCLSICLFHISVCVVGNLPKQLVCMNMHMDEAIIEVPVCTVSFLKYCCGFVPSQERFPKKRNEIQLFEATRRQTEWSGS